MIKLGIPTAVRSESGILIDFSTVALKYRNIRPYIIKIKTSFDDAYLETKSSILHNNLDALFIFGDRPEQLAACQAGADLGIIIIHHHGGDETNSGYIDEKVRHSISKYANIHFPASNRAKKVLIKMGEDKKTIFNYGSIALDACTKIIPVTDLEKFYIILYNPYNKEEISKFKEFLKQFLYERMVAIEPNGDLYSDDINNMYKELNISCGVSLKRNLFLSILASTDAIFIGNSSAFYVERSYWKDNEGSRIIPFGERNKNRLTGYNVYGCGNSSHQILSHINKTDLNSINRIKKLNY